MIRGDEIRGVLLDLDGTLYRQAPVRRAMVGRLARAHWRQPSSGVRLTRVLGAYRKAQESLRSEGFEGDVSAAQVDRAAKQSGVDAAAIVAWVDEWMETTPLDLVAASAREGLVDALDAMAAAELKLGVVSDYPALRKLEALGIADRFGAVVSAQDARVGAFKPNPRGILVALGDLGIRPAEALYVGDRADVDTPAATAAGVRCVLIGSSQRRSADSESLMVSDFQQLLHLLEGSRR
jgi:beta-phosphoglucomutase-like phosphatase (HAD superfamily)